MKQQQKTTVTLSMLWIGAMMIASRPGWIRNVRDFILGSTTTTTVVTHGGAAGVTTPVLFGGQKGPQ